MKPTLTLEQSETLTKAVERYGKENLLIEHARPMCWAESLEPLNEIDMMTMAAALTNGWETEKSPIDVLRENYAVRWAESADDSRARCYCAGVLEALRATGQTIEGINA
ncbi:hypothetical protein [Paenibacillus apiarius]|uniref:hypothetical protein n=1 Tax=Paenibacillus apiarius TaxID=46240 RepID=UPI003B3ACA98